jgi:ribitol-5-phosphate 2-dehydrogenase (NADP+) / D-ribitol-5-phosphate cytidylyltransferase
MKENITAILLMGGTGSRFNSALPKQFHLLSGKKIYLYALETFLKSSLFKEIILVCHPNWIEEVKEEVGSYRRAIRVIPGSSTRQESSFLGLMACQETAPDFVVIHDAVRPFVSQEILQANVEGVLLHSAINTCIPSTDTLIRKSNDCILEIPQRSEYMRGQTPQSFAYPLIVEAHHRTCLKNSSDDCRLIFEQDHPITIVAGDEKNLKITTEFDLLIAQQMIFKKPSHSH